MYYSIKFPEVQMSLENTGIVAFCINQIKSRLGSIVEVVLKTYHVSGELSQTLHHRWVIDTVYNRQFHNFKINNPNKIKYVKLELRLYNITSENPLWFTECMLSNQEIDDSTEYHTPNEVKKNVPIRFVKNNYVNLYSAEGVFLQVIRPDRQEISTSQIPRTDLYTILAPHLESESEWDNPINLFYEVMNQKEQTINIEK